MLVQREAGFHGQQFVEGVGQFTADHLMVHDPELVEDGLGEHELDRVRGFNEEAVGISEDAQGVIKALLYGVQGDRQLGDDLFSWATAPSRDRLISLPCGNMARPRRPTASRRDFSIHLFI